MHVCLNKNYDGFEVDFWIFHRRHLVMLLLTVEGKSLQSRHLILVPRYRIIEGSFTFVSDHLSFVNCYAHPYQAG